MHRKSVLLVTLLFCGLAHAARQCSGSDELSFTFKDLDLRMAFAILADFSHNKPVIDKSIDWSGPIVFECLPWRRVAQDLADQHNLALEIRDGAMYVRKK